MSFIDPKKIPALGHDAIDAAHRALATQINRLYADWLEDISPDRLKRAFADLIPVIAHHFAEETAIVAAKGFHDDGAHAATHESLLAELSEAVASFIVGNGSSDAIDVFNLIATLLFEHEVLDDQDYWLLLAPVSTQPM